MESFETIMRWVDHYKRDKFPGWGRMINQAVEKLVTEAKHDAEAAKLVRKIKEENLTLPPEGQTALTQYFASIEYHPEFM